MSNITNNNFNNLDLRISKSEYWDFILSKDKDQSMLLTGDTLYDGNLISFIDIDNIESCNDNYSIHSLSGYTWDEAFNNGITLDNIGFTGIDNGLITGKTIDYITGSTFTKISGDTRLSLFQVTGLTGNYVYPTEFVQDSSDNYVTLNGGFYQGFFRSGDDYAVLPSNIESEITFDLILKPAYPNIALPNTLNYKYPNNKGFFLYIGTRAENKFWYEYYKNDIDNYSVYKTGETSPIGSDIKLETSDGYETDSQNIIEIETDNKFLLFNTTPSGYNTSNFDSDATYYVTHENTESINLYQYTNTTPTGYSTSNANMISGLTTPYYADSDVINNAIGFRLKEDSETGNTYNIGYRMITGSCDDNSYSVFEEYSETGITMTGITYITIRAIFNSDDNCSYGDRKFKLWFYINGKLIFVSKELPELILKKLNDTDEKQEGVPFNISIGGGSQGLCDMIGLNDKYSIRYLLPIEQNFAGTFLGNIYKVKIYNGKMDYTKIYNNYIYAKNFKPLHINPTIIFNIDSINVIQPETIYKREIGNTISDLDLRIILNQDRFPLTSYEFYYSINNGDKIQITGGTLNPSGGHIFDNFIHDASLSGITINKIEYETIVYDTYSQSKYANRNITEINFDSMIFYGVSDSIPTESINIRNLTGRTFNSETTVINFNTGTEKKTFVFAIPVPRNVINAIDHGAWSLDITSAFNEPFAMDIEDAGGNMTPYNVYVIENAIPYSTNHEIIITLN